VKTIAERLAHARETVAKLSQDELAQQAGVSQSTIGNIEAGLRKNPRELLAIAKAAGVHAEWLKTGRGPKLLTQAPAPPSIPEDHAALLRDMLDAMRSPRLAQKLAELRSEVEEFREFAAGYNESPDPQRGVVIDESKLAEQQRGKAAR
jgi:transcriptional regulator with XRE-family HTH domain